MFWFRVPAAFRSAGDSICLSGDPAIHGDRRCFLLRRRGAATSSRAASRPTTMQDSTGSICRPSQPRRRSILPAVSEGMDTGLPWTGRYASGTCRSISRSQLRASEHDVGRPTAVGLSSMGRSATSCAPWPRSRHKTHSRGTLGVCQRPLESRAHVESKAGNVSLSSWKPRRHDCHGS